MNLYMYQKFDALIILWKRFQGLINPLPLPLARIFVPKVRFSLYCIREVYSQWHVRVLGKREGISVSEATWLKNDF